MVSKRSLNFSESLVFFVDQDWAACWTARSDHSDEGDRPTQSGGIREIPGQNLSGDLRQEQLDTEHQPLEELPMFRSKDSWPAVFRVLRSSPVPARPPRRSRHHTFRCLPLEQLEERSVPSVVTIPVSSLADSGGGTLREAITMADQATASNSYVINIVTPGTITLESVLPDLSRNITITGLGAGTSTVQRDSAASSSFRIFTVDAGETVNISGLTIKGGNAGSGNGGGLDNSGTLTVSNSVFSNNSAIGYGGGLANESVGTLTVRGSTFTSNDSIFGGGGLFNGGTATVSDSTFTSNFARFGGGGLFNDGTLTVRHSTFTGNNDRFDGGGLFNDSGGTATVSDSTFTSNGAIAGGGIFNGSGGTATVIGSTFTSNSAGFGGGLENDGTLTVRDSTFTSNSAIDYYGGGFGGGIDNFGTLTVSDST